MPIDTTCLSPTVMRLDEALRVLATISDLLHDTAVSARGLAEATDWQADAAREFHERASLWAGDVAGLQCAAETARVFVRQARDRAMQNAQWGCS